MNRKNQKKLIWAVIVAFACLLITSGCGPSKEELAQQAREKQAAINAAVAAALSQQARENQVAMQVALEKIKVEIAEGREAEERAKMADLAAAKKKKEQERVSIKGNVFVATKGGNNIKLALIQVSATPKVIFEKTRIDTIKMIEDSAKKTMEHEINPLIADLNQMMVEFDDKIKNYKVIQSQINSLSKSQEGVYGVLKELVYYISDTPSNRSAKDRIYQLSLDRRVEAEKLKPLRDNIHVAAEGIQKRLSIIQNSVQNSATNFLEILQQSGSPYGISNADGNFALSVARQDGSSVVLSATGARQSGEKEERYNWIKEVKLEPEQVEAQIFLSNNDIVHERFEELNSISKDLGILYIDIYEKKVLKDKLGFEFGVWNKSRFDLNDWVYSKKQRGI